MRKQRGHFAILIHYVPRTIDKLVFMRIRGTAMFMIHIRSAIRGFAGSNPSKYLYVFEFNPYLTLIFRLVLIEMLISLCENETSSLICSEIYGYLFATDTVSPV